jgi:hypothetical protein
LALLFKSFLSFGAGDNIRLFGEESHFDYLNPGYHIPHDYVQTGILLLYKQKNLIKEY